MERKKNVYLHRLPSITLVLMVPAFLLGCAGAGSMFVFEELPSIAHVHIGHAITGWKEAPAKKGLFAVAEDYAGESLVQAQALEAEADELAAAQKNAGELLRTLEPTLVDADSEDYGFKDAFTQAIDHLTFAAQSDDATENVIASVEQIESYSFAVVERTDLIIAMTQAVIDAESLMEVSVMAEEILRQVEVNVQGGSEGEVGIRQIRMSINEMLDREEPPYQPVAEKYLFGLIRLPDGKWMFSWLLDPFGEDEEGGDGGGGGY